MTDKRFVLINNTKPGTRSEIFDYQKKHNEGVGDELWLGEVVDMLNQLTEENDQLKQLQEQVANVIESKMADNVCNDYKMEVLKEIWDELNLDEVWFE